MANAAASGSAASDRPQGTPHKMAAGYGVSEPMRPSPGTANRVDSILITVTSTPAAKTNHLSCRRTSPRARLSRTTSAATPSARATSSTIGETIRASAYLAAVPTSGPRIVFSGRGPISSGPKAPSLDTADNTSATMESHTPTCQRGDGTRPSGNRSMMSGSRQPETLHSVNPQSSSDAIGSAGCTPAHQYEVAIPPASV